MRRQEAEPYLQPLSVTAEQLTSIQQPTRRRMIELQAPCPKRAEPLAGPAQPRSQRTKGPQMRRRKRETGWSVACLVTQHFLCSQGHPVYVLIVAAANPTLMLTVGHHRSPIIPSKLLQSPQNRSPAKQIQVMAATMMMMMAPKVQLGQRNPTRATSPRTGAALRHQAA